MKTILLCSALTATLAFTPAFGQSDKAGEKKAEANPPTETKKEVAVIETSKGRMVVEFWPDVAPKTVENFKKLAKDGFYDGTAFHRIIKGFMIQGGDPLTKDPANAARFGEGGPDYTIKAEFNARKHVPGVLSMARSGHPDSAGSQFFICHGAAPSLDGKYTGFGKLTEGMDVLNKIANTPVKARRPGGEESTPTERVEVTSIKIVSADSL
ncbi:MAG TPA: peptidylprolyl isomerase [Methylomirabilota bacterium]|nr:peptidylprolyl isomerase [Methylomirabilota bacterium]